MQYVRRVGATSEAIAQIHGIVRPSHVRSTRAFRKDSCHELSCHERFGKARGEVFCKLLVYLALTSLNDVSSPFTTSNARSGASSRCQNMLSCARPRGQAVAVFIMGAIGQITGGCPWRLEARGPDVKTGP